MSQRLRYIPPSSVSAWGMVEVTCRTLQSRFLLKPSRAFRELFFGVLGRAQELYPVKIHALVCLSTHYHMLVTPKDSEQLARFMDFFQGNLARKAGRLHDWHGKLWSRRYDMIPVSDEPEAQVARLRYVLENGCKENLVSRPGDWPGPSSVRALLGGGPLGGVWHDQTGAWEAKQRGEAVRHRDYRSEESIVLEPLPCWQHLPAEEICARIRHMLGEIENETAERHRRDGTRPLGRRAVLRVHPHDTAVSPKRRSRPIVHAASREVREAFKQAYRQFAELFRWAAQQLQSGHERVAFPPGSFPPSLPYVPPEAAPA
ncbi:MAG: transposase [Thermoanaerobaculia bacterium]